MSGLAPPDVVKTSGVNVACSTSLIRSSYIQVPLCFLTAAIVGSTRWGVVGGCVRIEDL